MDLSVVIVNWNTRALLLECLAATRDELEREARASGLLGEIIVVDNGSRDGSADAVREAFDDVEVLPLPENRGYAAGNNAGIAVAKGRILLLLNSDAFLLPGALRVALDVFERSPDVAAAGVQLVHPDGRLQNSIHTFPRFWLELVPRALLELSMPKRFPSKRYRHAGPIDVDAVLGAAFFVRRAVIDEIGPLCEDYFFFLEETELCWRIKCARHRVVHIPAARAEHRSGASSKRRHSLATRVEFHRSLYHFLRTNQGVVPAAAVVVLRVVKGLVSLPFLLLLAIVSQRQRERLGIVWGMLVWHTLGCPRHWGLTGVVPELDSHDGR
jgi:GT2 family glycosyltransferase